MNKAGAVLGALAAVAALVLAPAPSSAPAAASGDDGLIAFARRTGTGAAALYVVRADGSGLRRLSRSPVDFDPAWTPDGRRLVFASSRGGRAGAPELYVRDLGGRTAVRLTRTPVEPARFSANAEPAVSRNGRRVVFVRESYTAGRSSRDLYSVPADGGAVERLTRTPARESSPSAGEGGRLYFERDGWIHEQAGRRTRRIARGVHPAAGPPSSGLVAFAFRGAIWISDGGQPQQVVAGGADGGLSEPSFAPDGRRLVYVAPDGLFTVGLDGSDVQRVTATSPLVHDTAPAWQPEPQ